MHQFLILSYSKVKLMWICIALSRNNLPSKALRYDTCYVMVHTVSPATKHEPYLPLVPCRRASPPFGRYSLHLPTERWPGWVDLGCWLDRDKFPAPTRSPILTGSGVRQLRWSDQHRYHLRETANLIHWVCFCLVVLLLPREAAMLARSWGS